MSHENNVPAGWKLVPVGLTDAMRDATDDAESPDEAWAAMLAAAPQAPATRSQSTDFIKRTNEDYAAWCKTKYTEEFNAQGPNLHGLWAWQEQQRRMDAMLAAQGEPVAWMHWHHGAVRVFLNRDEAQMEHERLEQEYPSGGERKLRPLIYGDTAPQAAQAAQPAPREVERMTDQEVVILRHRTRNADYAPRKSDLSFARAIEDNRAAAWGLTLTEGKS